MEKPHYYYQIKKDSEVGAALADFSERCAEAQRLALEWAKRVGARHWYESPDGFAGGVAAVEFDDNGDRAGWDRVECTQGQVAYMPAAGTALEQEMFALPVVSETELIRILNFKPVCTKEGSPLPFTFGHSTPIVFPLNGHWYVDVPYECRAVDCEPIGSARFARRKRQKEATQ